MIRITVELVPFGLEHEKKELGKFEVWNDGTGTSEVGNYVAESKATKNRFRIRHQPRGRDAWKDLVARVMNSIARVEGMKNERSSV